MVGDFERLGEVTFDSVGIQEFEGGAKGVTIFFRATGKALPLWAIALDQEQASDLAGQIQDKLNELCP